MVFYDFGAAPAAAPAANAKAAAKSAPIQSATPGPGGSSSIRRLEAKGSVVVTQKDQVVTGETAVFDTKTNLVTMLGGVVLTQGKNVLRGDRLMVDMTTGVSRVESDSGACPGPVSIVRPGRSVDPWSGAISSTFRARAAQINRNNINHLYASCRRRG